MSSSIHIAHLTDLHISPDDQPYHGILTRDHCLRVLEKMDRQRPDLLVLSGDLAASQGELEAYVWLRERLDEFGCPYEVMLGNHDRLSSLGQAFPLFAERVQPDGYYFQQTHQGFPLLFLDSSRHHLAQPQMDWLATTLAGLSQPALLFIHHPPRLCGCAFMDEGHPLRNGDQVWPLLVQHAVQVPYVFCGHYHIEKTVLTAHAPTVFITPSSMMQIRDDTPGFLVNHAHPGWRHIHWDGERLDTKVEYAWC